MASGSADAAGVGSTGAGSVASAEGSSSVDSEVDSTAVDSEVDSTGLSDFVVEVLLEGGGARVYAEPTP